jgi:hypothetical protein
LCLLNRSELIKLTTVAVQNNWRILQQVPKELDLKNDLDGSAEVVKACLSGWKPGLSISSNCKFAFLMSQFSRRVVIDRRTTVAGENTTTKVKLIRKLPVWIIRNILEYTRYVHFFF